MTDDLPVWYRLCFCFIVPQMQSSACHVPQSTGRGRHCSVQDLTPFFHCQFAFSFLGLHSPQSRRHPFFLFWWVPLVMHASFSSGVIVCVCNLCGPVGSILLCPVFLGFLKFIHGAVCTSCVPLLPLPSILCTHILHVHPLGADTWVASSSLFPLERLSSVFCEWPVHLRSSFKTVICPWHPLLKRKPYFLMVKSICFLSAFMFCTACYEIFA